MSKEHSVWRAGKIGEGPTTLKQHREPIPIPAPGQYLVRIHAVSLNYRDVATLNGKYSIPGIKDGLVPCADIGAEVISGGERTSRFQPGDKVTALVDETFIYGPVSTGTYIGGPLDGTLQEYRCYEEIALLKAPDYLSYEELSAFPIAGITAWNALYGLKPLTPGQTVLVQGTGGVSLFGLLIAVKAGARVIVTSSSDEKLELAKKLGATHIINYKRTPDWAAEVQKLTHGVGAHHILDNVGLNGIEQSFSAVAFGGVITPIGSMGGKPTAHPDIPHLALKKQACLRGIIMGSKEQFEELLKFAEFSEIHPHIDRVFAFDKAVEALQYLESAQHFGKVVIRVVSQ